MDSHQADLADEFAAKGWATVCRTPECVDALRAAGSYQSASLTSWSTPVTSRRPSPISPPATSPPPVPRRTLHSTPPRSLRYSTKQSGSEIVGRETGPCPRRGVPSALGADHDACRRVVVALPPFIPRQGVRFISKGPLGCKRRRARVERAQIGLRVRLRLSRCAEGPPTSFLEIRRIDFLVYQSGKSGDSSAPGRQIRSA